MAWVGVRVEPRCPTEPHIVIVVSYKVYMVMRLLEDAYRGLEYLVYARATRLDDVVYVDDPAVPPQVVTPYSVIVLEPDMARNGVLHRHPPGVDVFSATDETYVNANNDVSLLYVDGVFTRATVRLMLSVNRFCLAHVPAESIIVAGPAEGDEAEAKRIVEDARGKILAGVSASGAGEVLR